MAEGHTRYADVRERRGDVWLYYVSV